MLWRVARTLTITQHTQCVLKNNYHHMLNTGKPSISNTFKYNENARTFELQELRRVSVSLMEPGLWATVILLPGGQTTLIASTRITIRNLCLLR